MPNDAAPTSRCPNLQHCAQVNACCARLIRHLNGRQSLKAGSIARAVEAACGVRLTRREIIAVAQSPQARED